MDVEDVDKNHIIKHEEGSAELVPIFHVSMKENILIVFYSNSIFNF